MSAAGHGTRDASRPSHDVSEHDGRHRLAAHEVRVRAHGEGAPVVLLSGCAVPSDLWRPVVRRLGGTRVVLLDRPGAGGTPWPGRLPTLTAEVDTLEVLLSRLERPAVLVAHSMAGPHAEAVARRRPDLVGRLVLVDGTVAWPAPRRPTTVVRLGWRGLARLSHALLGSAAVRRVVGRAGWWGTRGQTRSRSRALRRQVVAAWGDREAVAAAVAEQAAWADQLADLELLRDEYAWPGVPAVVLTATLGARPGWVADQHRLAVVLDAPQVVVEDARHLMMLDCPQVIADAVRAGGQKDPPDAG